MMKRIYEHYIFNFFYIQLYKGIAMKLLARIVMAVCRGDVQIVSVEHK